MNFSFEYIYFIMFKAPVELKLEGNEASEKLVYQTLNIDVFGDSHVDRDGTLDYSEKKGEKAFCIIKKFLQEPSPMKFTTNFFLSS